MIPLEEYKPNSSGTDLTFDGAPTYRALTLSGPPFQDDYLGLQSKMDGKLHLKLNTGTRLIANKYREGKMKSTLKESQTVRETVRRETNEEHTNHIDIHNIKLVSQRAPVSLLGS